MTYYTTSHRADDEFHDKLSTALRGCVRRPRARRLCDLFAAQRRKEVPCYAATHAHPQRITCRASRGEYFLRALTRFEHAQSSH